MVDIGELGPVCPQCGGDGTVPHRTTFCKVTGMCNEVEHWCCPKACELDDVHRRQMRRESAFDHLGRVLEAAEHEGSRRGFTLEYGGMRLWSYGGAILPAGEHGLVSVADLVAFARYLEAHDPGGHVLLHAFGLRWGTMLGSDHGPRLEWRDWD